VVGVIGDPIAHSLSPVIHNAAFDAMGLDWVSVAFRVVAGHVPEALAGMRALEIVGLSVTTPHKDSVANCVDELSDLAGRLGAVNCVTLRDGRLLGDSTDGEGFVEALRRGGEFEPAGRICVVIGAGGAARAVVLALAEAGAAEVVVVNRTPERAARAAALAQEHGRVGSAKDASGADLVVQATSLGMSGTPGIAKPEAKDMALDPNLLHGGQLVVDLVVNPPVTAFLEAAAARGARTLGGLGMLVHQGALAIERWTGEEAPVTEMWKAVGVRA
jgi:shikimate dehydrogenase